MSLDKQQYYDFDAFRELNKCLDELMDSQLDNYAELNKCLTEIRFQKRWVKKHMPKENAYALTKLWTLLEQRVLELTSKANITLKINVFLKKLIIKDNE